MFIPRKKYGKTAENLLHNSYFDKLSGFRYNQIRKLNRNANDTCITFGYVNLITER